jgi:hypothetical protein
MRGFEAALSTIFAASICTACVVETPVRHVSARAQAVRVSDRDPPAAARLIGPVVGTDGQGCGFDDARGTRSNAITALKEAAARNGADFVKVTKVTEPYSGHDCYHQEFRLEGVAFRVSAVVAPQAPVLTTPAPSAFATNSTVLMCTPPCSPGYACDSGACRALCNPPCGVGEVCRADRVCVPSP